MITSAQTLPTLRERIERLARDYPGLSPTRLRRKAKAMAQTIDHVTLAERALREAEQRRVREHEQRVVLPRRAESRPQIERLVAEGAIDRLQHEAAERLFRDWQGSGFGARVVADYEGAGRGGGVEPGMGPTAGEFSGALRAVGMILSGVLVAVVIEDWSPAQWAVRKGMPRNAGLAMLKRALDALCWHYGYKRA